MSFIRNAPAYRTIALPAPSKTGVHRVAGIVRRYGFRVEDIHYIAGVIGNERCRFGLLMVEEIARHLADEPLRYSVTVESLLNS